MRKAKSLGIALCCTIGLLSSFSNGDQPKKEDLAVRIAKLEQALLEREPALPVLPQSPAIQIQCFTGSIGICYRSDGTMVQFCGDPAGTCSGEPSPDLCPELCEAQGDIVVIDYDKDPCDAAIAGQPYSFVCMAPNQYAARPDCPTSFVLHYRSNSETGWVCEPSFGNEHLSRSVFDALLFERTRTNFLFNQLVNSRDGTETIQ